MCNKKRLVGNITTKRFGFVISNSYPYYQNKHKRMIRSNVGQSQRIKIRNIRGEIDYCFVDELFTVTAKFVAHGFLQDGEGVEGLVRVK